MTFHKEYDILKRSQAFGVLIIFLVRKLPKDIANYVITKQIIRSATSISANIAEAKAAISKKEFILYMNIAKREAKETLNWLEIIQKAQLGKEDITSLLEECNEITSILVTTVKTAQKNEN